MRKVILFMHISLDGFVCGPNGELDWATMTDDAMGEYMGNDLLKTVDTMFVGRVLFQGFEQYWPSVPMDPNNKPEMIAFAHWMADTPKIVFSNSLNEVKWKNSRLAKGSPAEEVKKLKSEPGGDIVIFGGASLSTIFAEQDLIDEYRFKLEPVILGSGRSLYKGFPAMRKLKLTHSKSFDSGVVALYYQPVRKAD